ncbi:uncharacterized protein LOC106641694 [Copidosoma floridanum]|uniref:uncharacterized protein LOC106641694 n=1 Tax=Copidosoma floridanum TaxID=29053 RepID=UPI0006C9A750|nr:uncharacterized protein LOC106641694 [Copidosoma floridanum]
MLRNIQLFVCSLLPLKTQGWNVTVSRSRVRYHFPRPNERKRIVEQGYYAKLSTSFGRKILMRRILKNRYVLSH